MRLLPRRSTKGQAVLSEEEERAEWAADVMAMSMKIDAVLSNVEGRRAMAVLGILIAKFLQQSGAPPKEEVFDLLNKTVDNWNLGDNDNGKG